MRRPAGMMPPLRLCQCYCKHHACAPTWPQMVSRPEARPQMMDRPVTLNSELPSTELDSSTGLFRWPTKAVAMICRLQEKRFWPNSGPARVPSLQAERG